MSPEVENTTAEVPTTETQEQMTETVEKYETPENKTPVRKKDAPKKMAAKSNKKATAKKGAKGTKKAAKKESKPRAKKEGLRKPQIAILKAMAKTTKGLTKPQIAEKSGVDPTKMGVYVGPRDGESATTTERWPFPSLFELKLVKYAAKEEEGRADFFELTAKGREVAKNSKAE